MSQRSAVAFDDTWSLLLSAYAGQGMVIGTMKFREVPAISDFDGLPIWFKPQISTGGEIQPAFVAETNMIGSIYTPPPAGSEILALTDGNVTLDVDGTGGYPLVKSIHLGGNLFSGPAKTEFSMTAAKPTGLLAGKFLSPGAAKPIPFGGVVFQKQNFGRGLFRFGAKTGCVELAP